jgi:hypothetical protein
VDISNSGNGVIFHAISVTQQHSAHHLYSAEGGASMSLRDGPCEKRVRPPRRIRGASLDRVYVWMDTMRPALG